MAFSVIKCPVCGSRETQMPLIEIPDVPVFCNVLLPDKESALQAPRGDINLVFCEHCGHVYNSAFDPSKTEYSPNYENSLHYSPKFQEYAESLARRLIEKYNLRGKTIVEIGCGKGDFLNLLCRMGDNRGIGFDPSFEEDRVAGSDSQRVKVIQDYYSEKYAGINADMIVCRHVLEHLPSPMDFLLSIRKTLQGNENTLVSFEVPDVMYTLRDLGIWDLIYEHFSYFTTSSLTYLFYAAGLQPVSIASDFGGQFIRVEAYPSQRRWPRSTVGVADLETARQCATAFALEYRKKVKLWHEKLRQLSRSGKKVAVWGAGSKGVTFLNIMGPESGIEHVVDINPHKRGRFIPGIGQRVIEVDEMKSLQLEAIIVMNSVYRDEIARMVQFSCEIETA